MLKDTEGNLLTARVDALVNTVNTVGVMGKGIALQFKRAFPANFRAYASACRKHEVRLGEMFVFPLEQLEPPRYVINFPTKSDWRSKSRLKDIEAGLVDLRRVIGELDLKSLALPPLGCGNGGLNWSDVRPLIDEILGDLREVEILVFVPSGAPSAEEMPVRTQKPRLSRFGAAVLVAYSRYIERSLEAGLSVEPKLALIEAHKVAYFLQESGWPLRLRFTKGRYGPYSDALNHYISSVEGHFISGYGDGTSGSEAALTLDAGAVQEAEELLARDDEYQATLRTLLDTLTGFEFPYGVELLSTVHFAACRLTESGDSLPDVVQAINEWSPRKAALFKQHQAKTAYDKLTSAGLLPCSS
ncbi:macro domain-containing protein [Cryptosporangium sp. NPDC051539]|uniref:type II toxin-antitoxin system antitoxin DNA ADP-ribosyl glycohydrolase DarG n=1 Tax=Cryptosporangium sp. NPDC051539 TaxID=3363962 RepID=UPI0037A1A857